ncbi:Glutamate synthase [NADPH] small chain [uncultured Clostridium sp.]|uniref:NAD(P)/FAD-dependent oxidoreductase n=1 Tax=uncultured Clostridium sp. TaxID=59620 RepID=UPI0008234BAB|nr:NAD(P)/FAD-dependent oxidoreductase [uncultured Clostridium sp.]SCK04214.1 Glutamate synthase [NADPH] small chain [uncultured Clostridium sp.]
MKVKYCDVAIIGGGPAGLASALAAKEQGAEKVLIIERDSSLGGILKQCIHPGFGLKRFNEELTGPEYANKFTEKVKTSDIEVLLNTMVLELHENKEIITTSSEEGITKIVPKAVVLSMGCRERTRSNIYIPGTRCAGIMTAGAAQRLINVQGRMVGKRVVILGSGDIGMIMARRLTLEGAKVEAVVEIMPYLAGLKRNKVQCLDDFGIELLLSHTITDINGNKRVESVQISKVDENMKVIKGTERIIECDTVLLSVGLIPENELTKMAEIELSPVTNGAIVNQNMETSIKGIFACGNVLHVNDLVDNVSAESEIAGKYAAKYAKENKDESEITINNLPGKNVRYINPQKISISKDIEDVVLNFRVSKPMEKVIIKAISGGRELYSKKALKVSPGEMESIKLKSEIFENIKEDIVVEVIGG